LGKAHAKAEQPLWQVELDTAIAEAITVLPTDASELSGLFTFVRTDQHPPPTKLTTASQVAAERAPRGPDASSTRP